MSNEFLKNNTQAAKNIHNDSISWLLDRRADNTLNYSEISWRQSKEWFLNNGCFNHHTNGFFSVCGVKATTLNKQLNWKPQPIINQPEIGILGFIVTHREEGWHWMLQAKAEPGNVGVVQLAPSVQATYSNYTCKHGGKKTPYLDLFVDHEKLLLNNTLQSEQGTRFLHKFNNNMVCVEDIEPVNKQFRWFNSSQVQVALRTNYAINTDARSVIVTAPWRLIAMLEEPFVQMRHKDFHWHEIYQSYKTKPDYTYLSSISERIKSLRQDVGVITEVCEIYDLAEWELDHFGIIPRCLSELISVRFYEIFASERETTNWSQPLVLSPTKDEVILFCQKRNGVLRFLLKPTFEVGLTGGVELGPSYQKGLESQGLCTIKHLVEKGCFKSIIRVSQSDEGGRFMQTCVDYSVCRLKDQTTTSEEEDNEFWVTLSELEILCRQPKSLTNEARSVVSLLLAYA